MISTTKNDIESLTFEESLKRLESIVEELDNGELELEKAIIAYENRVLLKNLCEKRLKDAQARIEKIEINKNNDKIQIKNINKE